MSDFSLTLVLRFKTSKIAHDMAKVSSTSCGYQYSEIAGSLSSVYFCGGDCVEERNDGGKKGRGETSHLLAVVLPPACCCSVSCLL